jgi:putative lipoprotein
MKKIIATLLFSAIATAQGIQKDKVMHFVAGAVVGSASYVVAYDITHDKTKALIASTVMSILAGVGKELIDSRKGGTGFNNQDIVATGLGGLTIGVTINLF